MNTRTKFIDNSMSPSRKIGHSLSVLALLMTIGVAVGQAPERPETARATEQEKARATTDDAAEKSIITEKLKVMVLPVVDLENTTLDETIDFLRMRMIELDTTTANPAEKGVNIVVRYPRNAKPDEAEPRVRSLKLRNVNMATTLQHVCDATGYRYSVSQSSVILEPDPALSSPSPASSASTSSSTSTIAPANSSTSTELSKTLSPLVKPDIESAKMVISSLEKLAASKNGAEKVAIQEISKIIKNTFTADYNVATKTKALEKAEAEAIKQEHYSEEYMKPNAFGTINETAARSALMKADEIRKKAQGELMDAREKLILQLRDADATIIIYYKKNDYNVVSILASTMLIINERSLPADAYRPSFTHAQIASLGEFTQFRADWLESAKNAEKSENYEEAIRLYAKARDEGSKKRCANFLAANLEELKLYGSALEYYEIAGNHEKAGAIRKDHPTMLADKFKVLNSDEIYAKISPSCVRVSFDGGHGSGFFFKKGGYILTNRHCVEKKTGLKVKFDDDSSLPAKIIATSPDYDLAIIKIELDEHSVIGFRGQEVTIGLPVALIGYPNNDFATSTMNSGLISNNKRLYDNNPVYQLDVAANHGNSGGPVVDQTGQLVGILTFGLSHLQLDKFNFAITVETVADFVQEHMK